MKCHKIAYQIYNKIWQKLRIYEKKKTPKEMRLNLKVWSELTELLYYQSPKVLYK